ncbi:MAG: hypothetical protein RML45_00330 [Acetobacteraceae bacterium]|nr:hypothetical protein [Acetobacteraceae bacterium]
MGRNPARLRRTEAGDDGDRGEELIAFARDRLAHYKAPRQVVFAEIPKTATGKIQKHLLRAKAKEMAGA